MRIALRRAIHWNYKRIQSGFIERRVKARGFRTFHFLLSYFLLSMPLGLFFDSKADPWKHLQNGDQAAQDFLNKVDQKKSEAGAHPFYKGVSQEANYKADDLSGRAQALTHKAPASDMVQTSAGSRPQIKIDAGHDPLITRSKEILENPLEAIGGKGTNVSEIAQGGKDEILTCEEPGEDAQYSCKSDLYVRIVERLGPAQSGTLNLRGPTARAYGLLSFPRVKHKHFVGYMTAGEYALKQVVSNQKGIPLAHIVSASGGQSGGWSKVAKKTYVFSSYYIHYSYRPIVKVPIDTWITECDALEAKVDEGVCSYVSKVCTQGPQTRIIDGVSVTRDCWQQTYTYNCSHPSKDDCGPLRARGCVQISSTCKQKVGRTCVVYTQTYQCKGQTRTRYEIQGGQTPFCLDGNCRDQSWELNDELMSSIAQLAILKEMQGQIKSDSFFKGEDNQCSKYILNFKDCCGSGKGWGKSVGLAGSCKPEEKLLGQKRAKKLCHYVGTYCAKKVLGKCVKKKSSFCCFSNKLLKAFHEQGRPQIGLSWGSPKSPTCRGFTIEEIQRIDFSKLDLSEAFEDLMKNYKPANLQDIGKKIGERLETIKKGMTPNSKQQPQQRSEG